MVNSVHSRFTLDMKSHYKCSTLRIPPRSGANLKNGKSRFTRDVLLLFCMFALRKDERKLQYSRSNILGFINTGYFTSDHVPDGIKMQPTIHFRISEKAGY
jgi:hypothetical protein